MHVLYSRTLVQNFVPGYMELFLMESDLEENPQASKVNSNNGGLSPHCALQGRASPSVIKMLLEAYPEDVMIQYKTGKLPIDLYEGDNPIFDIG
jgi:hypothetical protein